MHVRALKYFSPLLLYLGALRSFTSTGIDCFIPLIYAWILVPLLELFLHPEADNLSDAEEEMAKSDPLYDYILYAVVILLYPALALFMSGIDSPALSTMDKIGRIGTMGLLCGTLGINVGHELGHRKNRIEQFLASASLMISLYMHFSIEHNRGHHKRVATPEDPSSARPGEPVYFFWPRSIVFSYLSAWEIAAKETSRKGRRVLSFHNEMIRIHLVQATFLLILYLVFGSLSLLYYLPAALIGVLLLETVNYIEHYGLSRKKLENGRYERALPSHSWNSNHIIGRIMLFELSRHSDHHYLASRKYQVLRNHDDAPQMPTGYPGMMILSLIPPLWFYIMDRRIKVMRNRFEGKVSASMESGTSVQT